MFWSEAYDNAVWTKNNITATPNVAVSPDGTTTADKAVNSATGTRYTFQGRTLSSTGLFTASCYVKAESYSFVLVKSVDVGGSKRYGIIVDLSTGAFVSAQTAGIPTNTGYTITNAGNGWWRITVTQNATTTSVEMSVIGLATSTPTLDVYLDYTSPCDGTSGIYVWGFQTELGSFATSYIPTAASSVARSADTASMTGTNFSSWYTQNVGTFVAEADPVVSVSRRTFTVTDASVLQITSTFVYNGSYQVGDGSSRIAAKTAVSFGPASMAIAGGGSIYATSTNTLAVTANAIAIGGFATDQNVLSGHLASLVYYPQRLPNATLQSLTS